MMNGAGFLRTHVATHAAAKHAAKAAAAEELGEQILSVHATWATALFVKALLAILIVDLALLRVRQGFVCSRDLLERFGGLGVAWVLVFKMSAAMQVSRGTETYQDDASGHSSCMPSSVGRRRHRAAPTQSC